MDVSDQQHMVYLAGSGGTAGPVYVAGVKTEINQIPTTYGAVNNMEVSDRFHKAYMVMSSIFGANQAI